MNKVALDTTVKLVPTFFLFIEDGFHSNCLHTVCILMNTDIKLSKIITPNKIKLGYILLV